jgi:HSP20 family protein
MRLFRYSYPNTVNSRIASELGFGRSPWSGLDSEISRLIESAATPFGVSTAGSFPVDLYQDETNTFVRAELPGVNRENIEVEVVGGELTITASRKSAGAGADAAACDGAISRTVSIPEGTPTDKVTAAYQNGVLTVTLPKPEAAKPRKVTVQIS